MPNKLYKKWLQKANLNRASMMVEIFVPQGGIPTLVCGIHAETGELITHAFSGDDKDFIRNILTKHLRDFEDKEAPAAVEKGRLGKFLEWIIQNKLDTTRVASNQIPALVEKYLLGQGMTTLETQVK